MSKYTAMASDIIENVGGPDNIQKVIHCITRLRFTLKDKDKANTEKIAAISGVAGAVYNQGLNQYQVVIGQTVEDVYDEVVAQLGDRVVDDEATKDAVASTSDSNGSKNPFVHAFQVIIGTITGSMIPIIGLLASGGMINGLANLFKQQVAGSMIFPAAINAHLLNPNGSTFIIITTAAMAPFYFLPILVGFSAAKQLKANEYVVAAVMGVFLDPNLRGALNTITTYIHNGVTYTNYTVNDLHTVLGVHFTSSLFGIPVAFPDPTGYPSYAYTIFPAICAAAIAAPLGKWLHKHLNAALRPIFEPIITFFITLVLVMVAVGPIMNLIGGILGNAVTGLIGNGDNLLQLGIAALIIGGLYQCLVIFGLHWLIIPILTLQLASTGQSNINMIVSFTMLAQGAGALAVFVKTRKTDMKGLALPAALSALMGVTEPAIYGINLKYIKVFIMSSIGAAVGAAVGGFMGLQMYGFSGSLIGFPSFISNPNVGKVINGVKVEPHVFLGMSNLTIFWIATVVCFAVAFVLVFMFGYNDNDVMGAGVEKKNAFKDAVK
ncbi:MULTISPECIES: PTS transporter subunit EIIC [unclassified Lactococcus]|uniref:PTS transporter subunit EIIC n=1 Tax=unclassified Lactococcus TaxID=2643510 RepID=UPI0011CAD401|nr:MULTISPECIES: PTS transporter subunit EIIC [unclassified Lactococcus]MQW23358.1 PTS beta-glucoside transporter subunit IIABC [Lactococcus sp. dk101]TXK37941.1 PTS beta-glucoside transporter subunit IIABC [Lactococcus sp. dk310]TXK49595.1 PTS beta-glucoside transporter subunit IIABC [Lactococcus sp. dk322]